MVAYLLTGEQGVGKTSAIRQIVEALGVEQCGGFYTRASYALGELYGYQLVTIDGQVGILADIAYQNGPHIGKFGVVLEHLEKIGLAAISLALSFKRFVVIDEIGPMHECLPLFKPAILDVLTSSVPLLGTISFASDPWLDEIRQRDDVHIYELTLQNKDEVIALVTSELQHEVRSTV